MSIRIVAAKSLSYAPQYVALRRGDFEQYGVEAEIEEQTPGKTSIADIITKGQGDLVLGSLVFANRLASTVDSEIVGVSNHRSRHMLFARTGSPEDTRQFDWASSLQHKVIVVAPTFVPTSWVAFVEVLREHQVSLDDVHLLVGYTPEAVVEEFLAGQGDLLLAGCEEGLDPGLSGVGTLADGLGEVPWSVYCASSSWANNHEDDLRGFRKGLGKAQKWLASSGPHEVAEVLQPEFPNISRTDLEAKIKMFQRVGFWADKPDVHPAAVVRWARMLADSGMIESSERLENMMNEVVA
ncbi:MAG: hypothetical protein LKI24_05895 [Acidipropionibacterium sp.]|jgi:ABC-type nitrate/sulfonate/bicarbonate transport system substrate-binding protein|nr:hypothetical protein [Acidipropionibacterium sp.]